MRDQEIIRMNELSQKRIDKIVRDFKLELEIRDSAMREMQENINNLHNQVNGHWNKELKNE